MKFTAHFSRTELTQIIADALKSQGFDMESLALFDEHSEHIEFAFASAPVTLTTEKKTKEKTVWYGVYVIDGNEVVQWASYSTIDDAENAVRNIRKKLPALSFCIKAIT